ncbi:MAG: glycosyltransferase family 2 protein [Alphaproteobacteria bacterium]|nr:glycosyltransferase family 2 protein [Alphaproteobacteria bacterium]
MVELAVVVPTFNERDNVEPLLARLERALAGIAWEAIFVDDDSPDGTAALVAAIGGRDRRVRVIRRIGRRGLSSACIEGMLATNADHLAVIDADLQHDETLLRGMLAALREGGTDVVIGSRYMAGGDAGGLSSRRLMVSRAATKLSRLVVRADLTDPMSGFFMLTRAFFHETVRYLSGQGFKILIDLFASAPRPVRFRELPYVFRARHAGTSKLDTLVVLEYLWLLADKLFGRWVPVRFVLFVLIGLSGVVVHLAALALFYRGAGLSFIAAQVVATLIAMTTNFLLNNTFTYRDRRLRGGRIVRGLLSFYLACAIGAVINFQVAEFLFALAVPWLLAGFLGAVLGSVWNYGVTSTFTWARERPRPAGPDRALDRPAADQD